MDFRLSTIFHRTTFSVLCFSLAFCRTEKGSLATTDQKWRRQKKDDQKKAVKQIDDNTNNGKCNNAAVKGAPTEYYIDMSEVG